MAGSRRGAWRTYNSKVRRTIEVTLIEPLIALRDL
jgi:hypothetical protein